MHVILSPDPITRPHIMSDKAKVADTGCDLRMLIRIKENYHWCEKMIWKISRYFLNQPFLVSLQKIFDKSVYQRLSNQLEHLGNYF